MVTEHEQIPVAAPVRLRPDRGNWVLIVIFGVMGLALLTLPLLGGRPASAAAWVTILLLVAMFLVPALLFGYWQARAVVIADEDGLRWRGLGGWRMARWADVSDYYEQLMAKSKRSLTVETSSGRLRLNSGLWTATPELRKLIEQKAPQARTREWGILGMRPEADWLRRFDYNTTDNRILLYAVPGMLIALFGFMLWRAMPGVIRTAGSLGWGWAWASVGMLLFGLLPMALYFSLFLRSIRVIAQRRGQRITLGKDGPTYEDKECRIEARWEDISDLFIASRRGWDLALSFVVVTRQGAFNFSPSIKDFAVLRLALPKFATALPEAKWRTTESNVLGGTASRWSSRCEGIGKRIYHYRTRTNRALLFLATFHVFLPTLSVLLMQWTGGVVKGSPSFAYGLTLFFGLPILLGWWRCWEAAIETDADGITQRTLLGTRHLAWDEVTDYGKWGGDAFVFGVVKGAKSPLWFWMGIGDVEELKAEIQRNAGNSQRRTWNEQEDNRL